MSAAIGIVDYGMGNIRSLRNAIEYVGLHATVLESPARLTNCSHVILPGVGAFGRAMENLRERGFDTALAEFAHAKKPLLGICLGMQLFASRSLEFGDHAGLDLIPGIVKPFVPTVEFPVPHVGWNTIQIERQHTMLAGIKKVVDYYFVHSFHFEVDTADHELASSEYGVRFSAIVGRGSVIGCQFHPEKSQVGGLTLLERFAEWDGC